MASPFVILNLRQWSRSMSNSVDLTYFGSGSMSSGYSNAIQITQLTPSSADRLHYTQGLSGAA